MKIIKEATFNKLATVMCLAVLPAIAFTVFFAVHGLGIGLALAGTAIIFLAGLAIRLGYKEERDK